MKSSVMLDSAKKHRDLPVDYSDGSSDQMNAKADYLSGEKDEGAWVAGNSGNYRDPLGDATAMQNIHHRFSLTHYIEPLFVYWRSLIACLTLSMLVGWLALLTWPRTYESVAKLQLLVGRESVGLDPSSTTTQTLLMQKTLEEDVNSALEILGSREIAEQVVREIGIDNVLNGYLPSSDGDSEQPAIKSLLEGAKQKATDLLMSAVTFSGVRDPVSDFEQAVLRLQDTVSVYAPKKSSTMIVGAQSKSPEMAQAIVQSYTRHFVERHVNVATTEGSYTFFEQQAKAAESDLISLMARRSDLLQSNKLVSASNRSNALTSQQAIIEATILNTEAQLKQTQAEIDDLTAQLKTLERDIISGKQTSPDQRIIGMRVSLYNAELEESRLMALYKSGHPKVLQIKEQVAAAREALDKMEQDSQTESTSPNPIRLKLEEDLLKSKNRSVGLRSLLAESKQQLTDKHDEINLLLQLELQLEQLDREVDIAKKNLAILREKEEQARVVEDLRQQRISSVGIAQAASISLKPIKPKKSLIAAAFLLLGLGSGVCLIGIREFSRNTIRNSDDVRRFMGQAVLAEIPRINDLMHGRIYYGELQSSRYDIIRDCCKRLQADLVMVDTARCTSNKAQTIGVLGVDDGSGASLLAMTLALQYSEDAQQRTTLIDLDSKKRTVSSVFGLIGRLKGPTNSDGEQLQPDAIRRFNDSSLSLVGSSTLGNSNFGNNEVRNLMATLEQVADQTDVVILDFPPINRPDRILTVASQLDQLIVVVESEKTSIDDAARLVRQIQRGGAQISGVVLNKSRRYVPVWISRILG